MNSPASAPADLAGALLVLGGRSEIGLEVAVRLAAGRPVVLAARRAAGLAAESERVRAAGATAVHSLEFDAAATASLVDVLDTAERLAGPPTTVVLAFGILGDQARAEADPAHAAEIAHVDYVAQVAYLTEIAGRMRRAGRGEIIAFSSIAGARVRRANYVYGSAKAGLDGFVQGLTDALHGTGVHVLLVRPGFVIGRMTAGMDPAPLSSTPAQVAAATVRALHAGHHQVWVPRAVGLLAAATRLVPRAVWRRMPR